MRAAVEASMNANNHRSSNKVINVCIRASEILVNEPANSAPGDALRSDVSNLNGPHNQSCIESERIAKQEENATHRLGKHSTQ